MAKNDRPVVIRYPGESDTYEVASPKAAADTHPDAEIVGYAGSFVPYGDEDALKQEGATSGQMELQFHGTTPPPARSGEAATETTSTKKGSPKSGSKE